MKKAVIVTAYGEIEYLNKFVQQLINDQSTDVFIHLDKKKDYLKKDIIVGEKIHLIKNNSSIDWGGYSFLLAILQSWKEVLEYGTFDWVILCSGQDIIVRDGLDSYLESHSKKIFIDSWLDDKQRRAFLLYKWPKRYFQIIDKKLSIIRMMRVLRIKVFRTGIPIMKRKINWDVSQILFYKNWFWSCIPYEVIQWIIQYVDAHPDYLDVFKGFVAEEGFIVTTIMQSPYKDWIKFDQNGISHSLTFRKKSVNNHPPVLYYDDIPEIQDSGCYFARKIDINKDPRIADYYFNNTITKHEK